MNHRKKPERRTFLQDRFEILIKRQQTGEATFSELTELDEIVNRDPEIRDKIIRESMLMDGTDEFNEPSNNYGIETSPGIPKAPRRNLWERLKSLISGILNSQISAVKLSRIAVVLY